MSIAPTPRPRSSNTLLAALATVLVTACSADQYRRDADLEVGDIVRDKGELVRDDEGRLFGQSSEFTIEIAKDLLRVQLLAELTEQRAKRVEERRRGLLEPPVAPPEVPIGADEEAREAQGPAIAENAAVVQQRLETRLADVQVRHAPELRAFQATSPSLIPARVLILAEALDIASENNRDYQREKEQVYLVALDLTFQRYLFEARFGVTSRYDWSSIPDGSGRRQRDASLSTSFNITQQLATGGLIVFNFTNNILRRFTGIEFSNGTNHATSSALELSFSQPILRGAGRFVVQEPLVQAEREALYQLRAFERFRQDFAVNVAREYFDLLQQLDSIENARRSYVQFIDSREQSEALANKGRRSQIQLDQATSSELNARDNWIVAQRNYHDQLDRFKVTLGLPTEANVALEPAELENLRAEGVPRLDVDDERAIAVALERRLDYITEEERLEDATRKVGVAEDDLRTALDLDGGVAIPTVNDDPFAFRGDQATWRVGATLDLPVDKLAERNAYREALINVEVAQRSLSLAEDLVRQEVRDAIRRLAQLRESWRIAVQAVEVAERRVQSTALTLRMGRIEIRDALDATDALNDARNQLTQSLVDYKIARLELWRDLGLLNLVEEGVLELEPLPPDERLPPEANVR